AELGRFIGRQRSQGGKEPAPRRVAIEACKRFLDGGDERQRCECIPQTCRGTDLCRAQCRFTRMPTGARERCGDVRGCRDASCEQRGIRSRECSFSTWKNIEVLDPLRRLPRIVEIAGAVLETFDRRREACLELGQGLERPRYPGKRREVIEVKREIGPTH